MPGPNRRIAPGACQRAAWTFALLFLFLVSAGGPVLRAQTPPPPGASKPAPKADSKKAKAAYARGNDAERQSDWETAYVEYTDAASLDASNREYAIRREIARSRLVQSKMDQAERDAVSGRLEEAQKLLLNASFVDPLNGTVRRRLSELASAQLSQVRKKADIELSGGPRLEYQAGHRNFDYRGDTQGAYQELARQFGVEAAFDVDLRSHQVRFRIDDVDFPTAARLLGQMTGTFWRPLTARLFFVAESTAQKRREYEPSVVRTVLLPASSTPEQMTEMTRVVRDLTGITRADLDTGSRTLTLRASPQAVALASDLIDELEKPNGELILEIEILEVDRTYARNLGIVPPQTAQVFTVSTQQIEEAAASEQGLINVIQQILGSATPNVIAFGGGFSTFFARLPSVTANFSEMLSLVRHGRRILLRAQDGRPSDFFVGDRVPVQLITYSPSIAPSATTGTGTISNPLTNYPVGSTPSFIATAQLRGGGAANDLIVTNSADNTVSVLLGNGDGTFAGQAAYPLVKTTDQNPVWIATGDFNSATSSNLDVAVANKASNTISVLVGQSDATGAPNGTLAAGVDVPTGNAPVSVVAANFHNRTTNGGFLDLAVADQADDKILVFPGTGDLTDSSGGFGAPTAIQLAAGFSPTALAVGDFNADGSIDLVVAEQSNTAGDAGQIQVFTGNGDGTFNAPTAYIAGNAPSFVAIGDFNADGITDLAVANSGPPAGAVSGNSVGIYLGQAQSGTGSASGTFAAPVFFSAGTTPTSLAVADYNVDGLPDIAVADSGDNAVTILFNEGLAVFNTVIPEVPVDTAPVSIATADFNGDGRPDAATANSGAADATVVLNSANLFPTGTGTAGTQFPNAQYIDVGLKVKATPRIHPNNEVTLDLGLTISSLSAQSFNAIPVINNEEVQQTVRLKQDETAVVAGFRATQLSNAITGNPGIANIPGLGLLDQDVTKNTEDSQLLILVTPRLVRLAPRKDRSLYAGPGSLEGGAGAQTSPFGQPAPTPPPDQPQPPQTQAPAPNLPQPQR